MPNSSWNKDEIKKLALISGKPLEVQCASVFLKAGWQVQLGTYYHDVSSDKPRELDLLIHKNISFETAPANRSLPGENQHSFRLRVLCSCKGFPSDTKPATFSISSTSRSVLKPKIIYYSRGAYGARFFPESSHKWADAFLQYSSLSQARQIIGFDIFQLKENPKNSSQFDYIRKTDRDLYEGLDSAIKAAAYWDADDKILHEPRIAGPGYTAINIPLLITSTPFLDIAIDDGQTSESELKHKGYFVGLYPFEGKERRPQSIMSLIWDVSKLDEFIQALNKLFDLFLDEIKLKFPQTVQV